MDETMVAARPRVHARFDVTVDSSEAVPFDESGGPVLNLIRIRERFSGDIEAISVVRALQALRADRSARMTTLQRVTGRLGGREGSFVLEGRGNVRDGRIEVSWSVVPGSGTGELAGLRGDGGFGGEFGKGSAATLDYWFG